MSTLNERFNERFPNGVGTLHELENEIPPTYQPLEKELLAFFHQELIPLAEEVASIGLGASKDDQGGYYGALEDAASIIRVKAASLLTPQGDN